MHDNLPFPAPEQLNRCEAVVAIRAVRVMVSR
jgi:hypothetical protein